MSKEISVNLVDEMKDAYGAYALSVIVGRAIPNLYDGLKPVTRRVLTTMIRLGLRPDARYVKSARVEGETMGRLHPHGGAYGAMITASQAWTLNAPMIDIHGNSGSLNDTFAASRYTEAKLTSYAYEALLSDIGSWETRPNYDDSTTEPVTLNCTVPNLLVNGGEGIAVGYACRIPTHNLRGIAKALRCLVEGDTKAGAKHLIPDFPTGSEVVKDEGLLQYLQTGQGSIRIRATCEEETLDYGKRSKRKALIFDRLPIHIGTEALGDQVKAAIEKDQITTVADVRDESDLNGTRFVVVLKASAKVELAKAELFKYTSLDTKFSANNTVVDGVKPVQLAPYDILSQWLAWRDETIVRIFSNELKSRRDRLEIVQGLMSAIDIIDEVIDTIKRSKDKATARANLIKRDFTERQANAILDMRLSQLTKLDDKTLRTEAKEIQARIKELIKLNSKKELRMEYILEEVDAAAQRHGNMRRSKVVEPPVELAVTTVKVGRKTVNAGPKPRFVMIDEKKGIVTQERKMKRGCMVVQSSERLIFMCDNGFFYKTTSRHKGPIADGPTQVLYKTHSDSLPVAPVLVVFELDGSVYVNSIPGETLMKCTAKGKRFMPEGAVLLHLGGNYTVEKTGRKKNVELTPSAVKSRPVTGKGTKICASEDMVK